MRTARPLGDSRGFTIVEVLIASVVLVVGLLAVATMFPMGYKQVTDAGRMTLAVTAGRQILEDLGSLPFDSLVALNGYTTANPATAPANQPELSAVRRWAYMAEGAGSGFVYTAPELAEYGALTPFGGQAVITVTCLAGTPPVAVACPPVGTPGGTLRQAVVAVSVPGLSTNVLLSTVIVRMF